MFRLNAKLSEVLLLRLRATFHTLPLFYLRIYIFRTHARKKLRDSGIQPLEEAVNILNENLSTSINFHQKVNPER